MIADKRMVSSTINVPEEVLFEINFKNSAKHQVLLLSVGNDALGKNYPDRWEKQMKTYYIKYLYTEHCNLTKI